MLDYRLNMLGRRIAWREALLIKPGWLTYRMESVGPSSLGNVL